MTKGIKDLSYIWFGISKIVILCSSIWYKGGIRFVGRGVCMDVVVMGDDVEVIDKGDYSEEEEVLLGGGKYVGDGKWCSRVFFESRWISFDIPDGIVIDG